jgi:uncharacterized protein YbjT (DUF2867 family)
MILVTGATGSNGSELIKRLSAAGVSVRGMVRKQHARANDALPGVEFVTADFDDPASVAAAVNGVDRAFLVTNSSEHVEAQQLSFVDVARAAGVRHIVYLSQLHAIASSCMAFTHLRPDLYMQRLWDFGPQSRLGSNSLHLRVTRE